MQRLDIRRWRSAGRIARCINSWMEGFDRGDETKSALGNRFNEARISGVVVEGLTEFAHGGAQALIEFDKGVARPKTLAHDFAGDNFAGTLQQSQEETKRQLLKLDAATLAKELAGVRDKLKETEAIGK